MARQPLVGQGPLIVEASQSHTLDTPHSVGLLRTRDQPDADTSTLQNTTLTRDRHPWPRRDSNPQSQQATGRRPRLRRRGHWNRHLLLLFLRTTCTANVQVRLVGCNHINSYRLSAWFQASAAVPPPSVKQSKTLKYGTDRLSRFRMKWT